MCPECTIIVPLKAMKDLWTETEPMSVITGLNYRGGEMFLSFKFSK
jgi:hypothetical protein